MWGRGITQVSNQKERFIDAISIRGSGLLVLSFLIMLSCNDKHDCSVFVSEYANIVKEQKDKKALLQHIDRFIEQNPNCVDAYIARGDVSLDLDSFIQAKSSFDNVIRIDTNNVYALYKKGFVYSLEKQEDSAILLYNKALDKKRYKSVIIDHYNPPPAESKLAKYDVSYLQIIYRLAESFYFRNNMRNAFKYFTQCIEGKFNADQAYLYRATIYLGQKKNKEACDDIRN